MDSQYTGPRLLMRWHEIRAMGFSRAWWRLRYELRKRLGLVTRQHALDPTDPAAVLREFTVPLADEQDLLDYFRKGGKGKSHLDRAPLQTYAAAVEDAETTIKAADDILNHRLTFLGQTFDFQERDINWHFDPPSGRSWPKEPWYRIDVRSEQRLGDIKFTWELNRHQFWPTLGRAYQLTGNHRYPQEWVRQFETWCEHNPPGVGANWSSNLEHALRLVSWWFAAKMMFDSHHVTPPMFRRLIGLLITKARHIVADLDYSIISMANNHVIGDAMGLAFLGMAIPELREAENWRQIGLRLMWQEAIKQVHEDGTSLECSIGYHRFVMQFYLLIITLCDLNSVPVPSEVRQRIEQMAEFLMIAVRKDGTAPQFGDWDSGLAYRLNDAPVWDFRPCLSTAAVLFRRGDFKQAAGSLDQETIWLLGPESREIFDSLEAKSVPCGNRAFVQGGYFFQRSPEPAACLFIKNGPFTSHTHADLLSPCIHIAGQPVLVDSGTYTYNGSWRWRTYFRNTLAHNTVTVDKQGQALAHRAFRWLFPPTARNNFFAQHGRFIFDGQHDGYRRLGVIHRRIIIGIDETTWLCLDMLAGSGSHAADIRWHLAPNLSAECIATGVVAVQREGQDVLTIAAKATDSLDVHLARGDEEGPAGWYSSEYGLKQPAWEVVYASRASMPFCAATVLTGAEKMTPATPVLERDCVSVELTRGQEITKIAYRLLDGRRFKPSQTVTLGRIVHHDRTKDETLQAQCVGV